MRSWYYCIIYVALWNSIYRMFIYWKQKNLYKKRKVNKRPLFIKSQFCWSDKLGLLMKKCFTIFLPYIFQIVCVVIFLLCAIYGFFMKWLSYGSCYIYMKLPSLLSSPFYMEDQFLQALTKACNIFALVSSSPQCSGCHWTPQKNRLSGI